MGVETITSKNDFETKVKNSDKLVVVDFYAEWCGPCKMISPKVEDMSKQYTDVLFFKVDVDEVEEVAAEVGINAMPTFQLYKGGEKVAEVVGASADKLEDAIRQNL